LLPFYICPVSTYAGKYYLNDDEGLPAMVELQKDRLAIHIKTALDEDRKVYWYYDELRQDQSGNFGVSVISYDGYPAQKLEVASTGFAQELQQQLAKQPQHKFLKAFVQAWPLLRVLAGIAVLALAGYFWIVPALAERLAAKVPVSYEENLGERMYDAMKTGFVINQHRTTLVNEFFHEMHIKTPYNIQVSVVKGDILNAFAMPGGHIIIYDKMLDQLDNYTELAALLAHEFTHVQNKHTTRALFRQAGDAAFLSVFLGNVNSIAASIVRNADQLKSLSYSRSLEKEADLNGLAILAEQKIDCNGFVQLFSMLKREPGAATSEWMSSHPDLDTRIKYIQQDPRFTKTPPAGNELLNVLFMRLKERE
jgi:Zn-dependent protease with chaperone function